MADELSTEFLHADPEEVREFWTKGAYGLERHPLDLSREQNDTLVDHLGLFPGSLYPRCITVRQAILLKREFRLRLPPYELPELGSPLWYAMMNIERVSEAGGQLGHRNVHDMFFTMVSLGGSWVSMDDPVAKSLGFARWDGSRRQSVRMTSYKEAWGRTEKEPSREWGAPRWLRQRMKTPEGREEVARILTSGDHCLEFPHEVHPVVRQYIEDGYVSS